MLDTMFSCNYTYKAIRLSLVECYYYRSVIFDRKMGGFDAAPAFRLAICQHFKPVPFGQFLLATSIANIHCPDPSIFSPSINSVIAILYTVISCDH